MKATPVALDAEKFAAEIRAIADGIRKLRKGPFNDRTLVMLIAANARVRGSDGRVPSGHSGRVSPRDVKAVLDAIASLDKATLR